MPIFDWDKNQDRILQGLRHKSLLKICCKVLNEPLLTQSWIEHHARIVGFDNLVLADNMSTDSEMLAILEEYSSKLTIFRFSGSHNEIHWHPRFRSLYRSIRENARFVSFIDVDERLILVEGDQYLADARLLDRLEIIGNGEIIPTCWLTNALNSTDRFCASVDGTKDLLLQNIRWGKPILPSSLIGAQSGIHNAQYNEFPFSKADTAFFLLHLTQFPDRRIATSRNKLISRRIVDNTFSSDEIMNLDFSRCDDLSFMPLVHEMRAMKALFGDDEAAASLAYSGHHYLTFAPDGRIVFDDEIAQTAFSVFLSERAGKIQEVFNQGVPLSDALPSALLQKALEARDGGDETRAEALLTFGLSAFPDFRHPYGGPAFRKELMRLYLAASEWSRAEDLVPSVDVGFGTQWHLILFARAYSNTGHANLGYAWWQKVLLHDPDNGEAKDAVASFKVGADSPGASKKEAIIQDLHDVRELMRQSPNKAHWFMVKYFEHVGRSLESGYAQLDAMAEAAIKTVDAWNDRGGSPTSKPRVPRTLHKIWLTNVGNPIEPPQNYVDGLLEDSAALAATGWQTILWIQDKRLLPRTVNQIEASGGVTKIKVVGEDIVRGKWSALYDAFLDDRKFPFAADILRVVILNQLGGLYCDIGARIRDVEVANFVTNHFDYAFIFWETMFFQNSLMAMASNCELSKIFVRFAEDPQLVPLALIEPVTGLTEGQAFSGLMVTAILLAIWRPGIHVFPFIANQRLLSWSAQQSWYKEGGKNGNAYVPDTGPSFLLEERILDRGANWRQTFRN